MITPENVSSEIKSLLVEASLFESHISSLTPGEITHDEIDELEVEFLEFANPLLEIVPFISSAQGDMLGTDIVKAITTITDIANIFVQLKNGANQKLREG